MGNVVPTPCGVAVPVRVFAGWESPRTSGPLFPRSSYSGMGGGSPRCRVVSDAPVGFDPVMGRTADLFVQRGSGAFSRTPLPSCVFADNAAGLTCSGPRTSLMC